MLVEVFVTDLLYRYGASCGIYQWTNDDRKMKTCSTEFKIASKVMRNGRMNQSINCRMNNQSHFEEFEIVVVDD